MMRVLSVIFLLSVSTAHGEEAQSAPGRAVFWSPSASVGTVVAPEYRTQSMVAAQINQLLDERAKGIEIVVLIKSVDGRPTLSHTSVKDSIRSSDSSLVLPNIYNAKRASGNMLGASDSLKNIKKIDLLSFVQILRDHDISAGASVGPTNNGQLDAYEISLTGHDTEQELLNDVATFSSKNLKSLLFAAAEEPMKNAILPTQMGQYGRILASTASSSNIDGIYYKPEGAEYSIYYADTYLYITPDIFTGLMTGIFVFFVLLTGYSCLGAIQGNSIYPSKMPTLGREA